MISMKKLAFYLLSLSAYTLFSSRASFALNVSAEENNSFMHSLNPSNGILIARSDQLDNLLYNYTLSTGNNQVRNYRRTLSDYATAYLTAQIHYNLVTIPSTEQIIGYGFPKRDLIGGGTSNLRPKGSYSPSPTIDVYNHYTYTLGGQVYSQVREIKFNFSPSKSCPVSTFSSC